MKKNVFFSASIFSLALILTIALIPTAKAADNIGVPECDDYLAKYEVCIDSKVPAEYRGIFKQSLEQLRTGLRAILFSPGGGREILARTCRQLSDSAKTSTSVFGCAEFN